MILIVALCQAAVVAEEPREFFEARVRPLLAKNCFACHTASRMGGLEMSGREALLKGGNSGAAIMPGDPARSLMIQAVTHTHERLKMPPQGHLSDSEISDLKTWIRDGAVWPESAGAKPAAAGAEYKITPEQRAFWSFQPLRRVSPPEPKDRAWARGAIDRFVLAALEKRGLKPVRDADKRTLIRRAYYDLIGLPPKPEDVEAFEQDRSPDAFRKVVDRLLASPQYGERWGRYWLDIARYSDDKLDPTGETPLPQSFRYRDWVIQAFNSDMPYDRFIKAQIAGDLMPDKEKYQAGLGFYGLRPEFQDDRVDATTRGFLALTVACAQCHDHKFDPIPTKDYYSLQGVFQSTEYFETPIAAREVVEAWDKKKKEVDEQEAAIKKFLDAQAAQLSEILAAKTAQYLRAAAGGSEDGLDKETLDKWKAYLKRPQREHPYLPAKDPDQFQSFALAVNAEKREIDEKNMITLGGSRERRNLSNANLVSLERDKYFLWRDLFGDRGVYWYGDGKIDRFLSGEWKSHLDAMRARLKALKKELPEKYPFVHAIRDSKTPRNMRVQIRGSADNLGPEAPRQFLAILCDTPKPFTQGSGRLELAEGIASDSNPLTARVMANRVWLHHFGRGIVRTPSNFGQLGERPSHPELLDYLAATLVESGWSLKALHREIMLSRVYALSADNSEKNFAADPDHRLLWRHQRQRLDAEAIRDSLLWAGGTLDLTGGGVAKRMTDDNRRRTVYGYISRKKLDGMLALFDFANPNTTNEQRLTTSVPLQRLFFLNSSFVEAQAKALTARLTGADAEKIAQAYRLLFARKPAQAELKAGLEFLQGAKDGWTQYAQALLSSNEFLFVN